jgi:hypothetical protein
MNQTGLIGFAAGVLVGAAAGYVLRGADLRIGPPAVYQATGSVTLDGKPVDTATVTFWPANPADPDAASPEAAVTGPDGRFTLGDPNYHTGLRAGAYKVTVSRMVTDSGQAMADLKPEEGGARETLPSRYRTPSDTPLTATVAAGPNECSFTLETKPGR